jgi:hypothetical protein
MAITQAQYDAYLAQAIEDYAARKGADSIAFSDQAVHFQKWSEIWDWLEKIRGLIAEPSRTRTRYAATSKGI